MNAEFMSAQSIGKSLLVAFASAGAVAFFLMMGIIPIMATVQRLTGKVEQKSVVVNPAMFMRTYGIAAALMAFVAVFAISLLRFHRRERVAIARH